MSASLSNFWLCAGAALSAGLGAGAALRAANGTLERAPQVSVVIVGASAAALVVAGAPDAMSALKWALLAPMLVYLAAFDLAALAIPVWPALAFAALGLAQGWFEGVLSERAAAAFAGAGAFLALDALYRLARGRSGLGAGDALAAALIGAWGSFEGLIWSVALGGMLGLAWRLMSPRTGDAPMPFVPALSAGLGIYAVIGGRIL